jgi:glycosyltransferase involved in cell wall biosynthesis
MRILIAHNHYNAYSNGGEANVVNSEYKLLKYNGHKVKLYERSNSEISAVSFYNKLKYFKNIGWSEKSKSDIEIELLNFKPDILHLHNYKHLLTPSVLLAAKELGIKTVLTVHNYRLCVPCGNFMNRHGQVCTKCLDGKYLRILSNRCSNGSLFNSLLQYRLFKKTKKQNNLNDLVDLFLPLTEFAKLKLIEAGINHEQIRVKPNFVIDPYAGSNKIDVTNREGAIFIGRATQEKGLLELVKEWNEIDYPLSVVGDGPDLPKAKIISKNKLIEFHGEISNDNVMKILKKKLVLIFPSTIYEGLPLTILESFSYGVPVIATDIGPRSRIITHGEDGFLYDYKSFGNLKRILKPLVENRDHYERMALCARQTYLTKYSEKQNLDDLVDIYKSI